MERSKKAWWWTLAIVAALGFLYYWKVYTLTIVEPPVQKQLQAQVDAVDTKEAIMLPIPVVVGKTSFDSLDAAPIESALKERGFVEQPLPEEIQKHLSFFGPDSKTVLHGFVREDIGVSAVTIEATSGYGRQKIVMFLTNDGLAFVLPQMIERVKRSKGGTVGVGPLRVGMSQARVMHALKNTPHRPAKDMESVMMSVGGLSATTTKDFVALLNAMWILEESGTMLSRGRYQYGLFFCNDRLAAIQVIDVGPIFSSRKFPPKDRLSALSYIFDAPS
jgi:hypothetical protein